MTRSAAVLRMLGVAQRTKGILEVVAIACQAGMRVAINQETLNELEELLDRHEREDVPNLEADLAGGVAPAVLVAYLGQEALAAWMESMARGESHSWSDFRQATLSLIGNLKAMGVEIVPERSSFDLSATALMEQFKDTLTAVLEQRNRSRHAVPLRHDALMLLYAFDCRRDNPASSEKVWPGGLIVTPDKNLNETYRRVCSNDVDFPVAVTLPEWMGIVSNCSDPRAAETVAATATSVVAHETLLGLASRFPLEAVRDVVRAISGTSVSDIDIRATQLTFDEVFADQAVIIADAGSSAELVSKVLAQRHQRLATGYATQRRTSQAELQRASTAAEVAAVKLDAETKAKQKAEENVRDTAAQLTVERSQREGAERRARRLPFVVAAVVLLAILVTGSAVAEAWSLVVGVGLSLGLVLVAGLAWVDNSIPSVWLLFATLIPAIAGLLITFH